MRFFIDTAKVEDIKKANDIGPARSPTVLLTFRPSSAKVDAHWLTACSLAPAQVIISITTQNIFMEQSSLIESPFSPSSCRE